MARDKKGIDKAKRRAEVEKANKAAADVILEMKKLPRDQRRGGKAKAKKAEK